MKFCRAEHDGHLLIVTIDRPDVRNALHRDATDELDQVWNTFESDPELRVAILTGTGDKSFCAGYDMKAASESSNGADYIASRHPRGLGGLTLRYGMAKPLVSLKQLSQRHV